MANFFKEYQKQVKETAVIEETAPHFEIGQAVWVKSGYVGMKPRKRYFADYVSGATILLAETKAEALKGYGYLYNIADIERS